MAKLKIMKKLFADRRAMENIDMAKDKAKEVGWVHFFQDHPVTPEFKEYLEQVAVAMPHVKFFPFQSYGDYKEYTTEEGYTERKRFYVWDEFGLYMDEYPFDMGRVNYRNNAVKGVNSEKTYGVYSRKIDNNKYSPERDQRYMVMTTDLKKAVKSVRTYITPYTHAEMAMALFAGVQEKVERVKHDTQMAVHRLFGNISRDDTIAEMLSLVRQGVQFKTEAYQKIASQIVDAYDTARDEANRRVSCLFVRVRHEGEFSYVDTIEASNVATSTRPSFLNGSTPTTYSMDELPEDLAGAISVLSILEDGQYVPRVGQKVDEITYWIERG